MGASGRSRSLCKQMVVTNRLPRRTFSGGTHPRILDHSSHWNDLLLQKISNTNPQRIHHRQWGEYCRARVSLCLHHSYRVEAVQYPGNQLREQLRITVPLGHYCCLPHPNRCRGVRDFVDAEEQQAAVPASYYWRNVNRDGVLDLHHIGHSFECEYTD